MPSPTDSSDAPSPLRPVAAPTTVVRIVQSGSWLRWIPAVLTLLLGLWLGHWWGARKLEAVRQELAAIKAAEDRNDQAYKDTTERLKLQSAELEARHKAAVSRIESDYASDRQQLQKSLDLTEQRYALARRKVDDTASELSRVRVALKTDGSSDNEALRRREAELVEMQRRLEQQSKAIDCLRVPVPAEELAILNRRVAP